MKFSNFFRKKKKRDRRKIHKKEKAVRRKQIKKHVEEEKPVVNKNKAIVLSGGKPAPLFIADKGEVVEGELLLDADSQYLLQKLTKETSIASYVYVIPPTKSQPAIVDLTIDGVWAFVRESARKKLVSLKITDVRVEDVNTKTKRGELLNLVRAVVKCEDGNGFVHYAVKDEPRYKERAQYDRDGKYIGKIPKFDPHAATIALEKAQKKAVISHPSFPRIQACEFMKRQLLANAVELGKLGLKPEQLLPAGGLKAGRGKYSDVFAKGKSLGFSPQQTREVIASTGKRLSERNTTEELGDALKKLNDAGIKGEVVDKKTGEVKNQTAETKFQTPSVEKKPVVRIKNVIFPAELPAELTEHLNYKLTFSKYINKTIKEVYETDADYFRYLSGEIKKTINEGKDIGEIRRELLSHLNPATKFLKEKGLIKLVPESSSGQALNPDSGTVDGQTCP